MNFLFLGFVAVLGALLAYSLCCLRPAKPALVEPLLVYDVSINTAPVNIAMNEENRSERSVPALSKIPFVRFGEGSADDTLYVSDAFTYEKVHRSSDTRLYAALDDEKVLLLIKGRDSHAYENIGDAIGRQKTFYCGSPVKEGLLDFVCLSNDIDPQKARRVQEASAADIIVFFGSLNNAMPAGEQVDFVSYDKFDINRLKFYIPYCKIRNLSLDIAFKNTYKDRYPIKTCICIDMLLYGSRGLRVFPKAGGAVATDSFLSLFFEFFEKKEEQMAATARGSQVLEQFEGLPVVEPGRPVRGYRDGLLFYSEEEDIGGVPITKGVTVVLKNQPNGFENDRYVAESTRVWRGKKKLSSAAEVCIGKPEATREECPGVWDAPCQADTDCPYFQQNRVYPNYFGGCVDGYCQMPLGVKRVGYRGGSGEPLCHGAEPTQGACDSSKDYAFPLDTFERRRAGPALALS